MKEIPVSDFRKDLAEYINRVAYGGDRVILERRGKKLAALVPIHEFKGEPKVDPWVKMARRGPAIDNFNREHLRNLTLQDAIQDVESLLCIQEPLFYRAPSESALPISLARILKRERNGGR